VDLDLLVNFDIFYDIMLCYFDRYDTVSWWLLAGRVVKCGISPILQI